MSRAITADDRRHSHVFDEGNPLAERNTRWAMALTALMMVAEIAGGWLFNSMALLADGWHMSSHALALGLSALAYAAARRFANDPRFAFGTWKIEVLGGYTSAICLLGVATLMLYQSAERLVSPVAIHYDQAIAIAIVGPRPVAGRSAQPASNAMAIPIPPPRGVATAWLRRSPGWSIRLRRRA